MKRYLKSFAPLIAAGTLLAAPAHADDKYPDHPINMVVPFSAGGPTDNVARSLAEAMRQSLGETVVVENKGGAGGTIGISQVARAKPDGYNVLLMHIGFTTSPSLYKSPGFDPQKSFQPLGLVVDVPMTIIARSDFPANNIQELVEYVKANADKVSLANAGIGAASHLCGTMFMQALGVDLLTIPYKGTGPAMNDLLGKQVDFMCDQTTNTTQHIKAGTVKAYAVTSNERVPTLPDLPTLQESGFKDFQVGIWHGLWAPAGTPKPVTDKLVKALQDGMANEAFKERMAGLGANVLNDQANPEALAKHVDQQLPLWKEVFRKAGVEPQ
ncbi:tripartite tricarboxylate transporter substrate binding protein BugD [Paracandidimonas soli]|jgi:tripartite-type tricarboxylate transporter receptor subunit TctC|uniref:Tripartite-type tricarboxylate transporter receptor subunit TctC n=1 Tax=Paracandidimonas soli TaxID=1917182 RepID=A0A4R3VA79_9BURK|nr:tripartite tricarboxylate transporter substrate binding protein BugD [Paracandidimonas soli]TCV00673.1 tripartite-type tricarboxylate transporter receptor subunit TctC [Paracandidimonas soli]